MVVINLSDKDHAANVMKRLKENDGYCPCRIVKTPDTKCMCKEFREQIKKGVFGKCHCGLYEVISDYAIDKNSEVKMYQ